MKVSTAYMKACGAVVYPVLALIGTTRHLPDWLALALLAIPVLTLNVLFPAVGALVAVIMAVAFGSVVLDMYCKTAER